MSDFALTSSNTISMWPWAAARWSGMSSPIFVALTRAPRAKNISTNFVWPSLAHQCSGLKPWSSLKKSETSHTPQLLPFMECLRNLALTPSESRFRCRPARDAPELCCSRDTSRKYPPLFATFMFILIVQRLIFDHLILSVIQRISLWFRFVDDIKSPNLSMMMNSTR